MHLISLSINFFSYFIIFYDIDIRLLEHHILYILLYFLYGISYRLVLWNILKRGTCVLRMEIEDQLVWVTKFYCCFEMPTIEDVVLFCQYFYGLIVCQRLFMEQLLYLFLLELAFIVYFNEYIFYIFYIIFYVL